MHTRVQEMDKASFKSKSNGILITLASVWVTHAQKNATEKFLPAF